MPDITTLSVGYKAISPRGSSTTHQHTSGRANSRFVMEMIKQRVLMRLLASSLLASQTHLPSTSGAFASALELVSAPLSQLVSRMTAGS